MIDASDSEEPAPKMSKEQFEELNRELRARAHDHFVSVIQKSEEATIKSAENAIKIILLINAVLRYRSSHL